MIRVLVLIAVLVLLVTAGCDYSPKIDAPSPAKVTGPSPADPFASTDWASVPPEEVQQRIDLIRTIEQAKLDHERTRASAETRRAITRDLRWMGTALFAIGAGLAIASAFVALISTRAAWTAFAVSGVAYGGSWLASSLAALEPFAPYIAGASVIVGGLCVGVVVRDWYRNRQTNRRGEELAWNEGHVDAGIALQAEAKRMTKAQRKAERDRVVAAHERMDAMGVQA